MSKPTGDALRAMQVLAEAARNAERASVDIAATIKALTEAVRAVN